MVGASSWGGPSRTRVSNSDKGERELCLRVKVAGLWRCVFECVFLRPRLRLDDSCCTGRVLRSGGWGVQEWLTYTRRASSTSKAPYRIHSDHQLMRVSPWLCVALCASNNKVCVGLQRKCCLRSQRTRSNEATRQREQEKEPVGPGKEPVSALLFDLAVLTVAFGLFCAYFRKKVCSSLKHS
jgi:hypothetical protein